MKLKLYYLWLKPKKGTAPHLIHKAAELIYTSKHFRDAFDIYISHEDFGNQTIFRFLDEEKKGGKNPIKKI